MNQPGNAGCINARMTKQPESRPTAFADAMASRLEEIAPLTERISEWAVTVGVPQKTIASVLLMLDELISNIVMHGYRESTGPVEVSGELQGDRLVIVLKDRAPAFNPLEIPRVDTSLSIEDRDIGGLGVHFVRTLADELAYRRIDAPDGAANELRIVKRVR
jgi:serine/threonine-protein kinase RsbW